MQAGAAAMELVGGEVPVKFGRFEWPRSCRGSREFGSGVSLGQ